MASQADIRKVDNAIAAASRKATVSAVVQDDQAFSPFGEEPGIQTTSAPSDKATPGGTVEPNRRQDNPLTKLASYTYQLSLYIMSPAGYNEFVKSGRKDIHAATKKTPGVIGTYLVAQSGGINNTTDTRAPGFKLDYYMDDLRIKNLISPGSTASSALNYEVSFTITEPYGFSFISQLRIATSALGKTTGVKGNYTNASRQFFTLGIKFLGYNSDGSLSQETFQKYYDILITKISFKLNGRNTVYNVTASPHATAVAAGTRKGNVLAGAKLVGSTVKEMLTGKNGLITKLNSDQATYVKQGGKQNTYDVIFIGDAATEIANASVVSKADLDKAKWPNGRPKDVRDINPGLNVTPEAGARTITFKSGTPIIQAITQVITQSQYVERALTFVYKTDNQPDPATDSPASVDNVGNKYTANWFNISFSVTDPVFDDKSKDFAYKITYIIQIYKTPFAISTNAKKLPPYYGPIKKYEYWYTGKNSEILKYEQTLDNTYQVVALTPDGDPWSTGGPFQIPVIQDRVTANKEGRKGFGPEGANEYRTSILDQSGYTSAKIEILGDPDWLSQDGADISVPVYPFYGSDGYSINPKHGQIFIEINFNEAIDYDNDTGLLGVNDKILFWQYPPEILNKMSGISYMVSEASSVFSRGKFTQELTCKINPFGFKANNSAKQKQRQDSGADPAFDASSMASSGLKAAPPSGDGYGNDPAISETTTGTPTTQRTVPTPSGPTMDDDANLYNRAAGSATLDDSGRGSV